MLPFIIAAALATTIDADLRAIAALPGEPSLVSAGGITRRDTAMATLENPSPFEAVTTVRRLVLVGGFDGDEASARAVMDAVRWIKSKAPAAVRRSWIVSAMPLANPDANTAQFEFPPGNGFFDDAQVPESRYLWRWLSYQAPDHVVVFSPHGSYEGERPGQSSQVGRPRPTASTTSWRCCRSRRWRSIPSHRP